MSSTSTEAETLSPQNKDWFEVELVERGEKITRTVRPLIFDTEKLYMMWEKSRKYKTVFNDETRGDYKAFVDKFFYQDTDGNLVSRGLFWVVDDFVGIMYITEIRPGIDAVAHFLFFDAVLNGRDVLVKALLKHVFEKYQFHRLSAEIALYANPKIFTFVEALGFKHEGRRRQYLFYNGNWSDLQLYYILKEKFLSDAG